MTPLAGMAIILAATVAPAQIQPRALAAGGSIEVILSPAVLQKKELLKYLTSGLTTVIVATIDEKTAEERIRGALRIEIRDDLWNEVFVIGVIDGTGGRDEAKIKSLDELRQWWSSTRFRIATMSHPPPSVVHLKVDVIPFSASEQAEAQRWLLHSIDSQQQVRSDAQPREAQPVSRSVFDMIIATSVQQRPLLSWRWTVPVTRP